MSRPAGKKSPYDINMDVEPDPQHTKSFASGECKTGSLYLANVLKEAKSEMQNEKSKNGITVALLGGSGRGKSTILRKIFIDDVYAGKDYIVHIFTESASSDAFKGVSKDVIIDGMGVDQDAIHFCYKMNQEYDKKYNFVLIIDDCIHIRYQKMIERMFLIMRNSNITSIVSIQHARLLNLSIRNSIYFAICMGFNGEEGVEICTRTWIGGYLPGKSIGEKIYYYQQWAQEGHRFFLLDNLNHRCYKVDENYMCEELFLQKREVDTKKRKRPVEYEYESEE
jgi:hypothetical protein